ncbi:RNA exonuclease 3 [Sporothrix eucalyptigena]|uniref:RNA exonuclease 3 n=1 Tax=Sporothrix eucalyptigena TaxID=1812306 RepID=A0ABP0AQ49_9PEZI
MSIPGQLLKHIQCPNGINCMSVKCLFGHPEDLQPVEPTVVSSNSIGSGGYSSSGHGSSGFADKRVRTDYFGNQNIQQGTPIQNGIPPLQKSPMATDSSSSLLPTSPTPKIASPSRLSPGATPFTPREAKVARPESPSALKRKRKESTGSIEVDAVLSGITTKADGSTPASTSSTPSSQTVKPKTQPPPQERRKAETLNPRYVAKAPAKHEIRLRLVKLLHQEFTRLNQLLHASKERPEDRKQYLLSPQGLIWLALDTEEHYATTKSSTVYSDTIKHRIMEFKRMTVSQWVKERKEAREKARLARQNASTTSAPTKIMATLSSANAKSSAGKTILANTSAPAADAPPKPIITGLPPSQDVVLLKKHFLTPIEKLANHGFVPTIPTDAEIKIARDAEEVSKGWEQCDRCTRRFQVFPGRREEDGALTSGGSCQHHPGRLNRATQVWTCCSASASDGSKGCETAPSHVFKVTDPKRLASLWNFIETPPNSTPKAAHKALCFDCEMAHTVYGMEVVRVTATSWPQGDVVLDVLVRPLGTIIDFNSRFSGVFASDFAAALPYSPENIAKLKEAAEKPDPKEQPPKRPAMLIVPSPQEARDLLQQLISPETILIGHALENDLKALRMVHNRISDTALLFPHPKGLPIRYSLRVLAKEHMDRVVQAGGNTTGHDSAEDARVAGELVLTKIKSKWEDMRRQGWKLADGQMTKDS